MNKVGNNVKVIRLMHGESQQKLADSIGITQSMLSMCERGERTFVYEYLELIAKHYNMPVEALLEEDYQEGMFDGIVLTQKNMAEMVDIMFPLACSETALQDALFVEAYKATQEFYNACKVKMEFLPDLFNKCLELYDKSWETLKTIESAINTIALISILCSCMVSEEYSRVLELYADGFMSDKDFTKWALTGAAKRGTISSDEKAEVVADIYEEFMELIYHIKANEKWRDIGDYYFALRYQVGIVDNELPINVNRKIGYELIKDYVKLKNKYAANYLLYILKLIV